MLKRVRYGNIYTKKEKKPVKVREKLYVKHVTSLGRHFNIYFLTSLGVRLN